MGSLQLQDKVILITGALGAAGRAAIELFLDKGALVAASDIKTVEHFPDLEDLQKQYGSNRLIYVEADFMKEDQVKAVMAQINKYFGRLNGSYHNVYINAWGDIANLSLEEWEASITGTLTSTFLVCKYAAELMIASGGGSIVNVSSILGGKIAMSHNAGYGAAKAGVEHLTRIIAVEYAEHGIRANAVVPGDFKNEQVYATMSQEHFDTMKKTTLIGRSGTPNEINEVAAFLLSDAASYVTGSMYPVNGGLGI
ncbi:SDR family NAD(P)-dependent oxidoreductase [Paenibacillus eucommiae]|uniref:NAD(P)-dependent dehydrogenase (Short-subunit alcohol dehydrogenase family) n=1 Tax=Paenibacillus eucommiae TaxID=1355755 RepID=A0ABS4J5J7_9BACL|nr:SDR family oxidoreductase [Paenibacillus eucommiae]MBP1994555.1 NAD(P)-dependent dehydrogenase (short-subunit alcohol dehydrogenase family) [Paenibacillus eucommiae]